MNQSIKNIDDTQGNYNSVTNSQWEELRSLILGVEQEVEEKDESSVSNVFVKDISNNLPQAISISNSDSSSLTDSLSPIVTQILEKNVRENPKSLADALFPIMGPAIRKSISETIKKMIQSFNKTLESSLSTDSIKWRVQALATGKSFAEIVMIKGLLFRVEQVFLIHKKTSLLIKQVDKSGFSSQDGDMVSGMLRAIQDFVQDSFKVGSEETLNNIQVGELTVWIEEGPYAIIAAVVRGNAPEDLRDLLIETQEKVHRDFAIELEAFQGDTEALEDTQEILESCLLEQAREKTNKKKSFIPYIVLGLVAILIFTLLFFKIRNNYLWSGFVEELESYPGIIITKHEKHGGKHYIFGLKDFQSIDPQLVIQKYNLDTSSVVFNWEIYQALSKEFILYRAKVLLEPPETTNLELIDNVLIASGSAPKEWIEKLKQKSVKIIGINSLDTKQLTVGTRKVVSKVTNDLYELKTKIEAENFRFDLGNSEANNKQSEEIDKLVETIMELIAAAKAENKTIHIEILGHTDDTGYKEGNLWLSKLRAEGFFEIFLDKNLPEHMFTVYGMGSSQPIIKNNKTKAKKYNRRVSFKVIITDN